MALNPVYSMQSLANSVSRWDSAPAPVGGPHSAPPNPPAANRGSASNPAGGANGALQTPLPVLRNLVTTTFWYTVTPLSCSHTVYFILQGYHIQSHKISSGFLSPFIHIMHFSVQRISSAKQWFMKNATRFKWKQTLDEGC